MARTPLALTMLTTMGTAYLVWLGIGMLTRPSTPTTWPPSPPTSPTSSAGSATGSSTSPHHAPRSRIPRPIRPVVARLPPGSTE
nr:hypothetical protein [Streptosporangium amethystogenes]